MSELKAHNINDLSLHDIANSEFYLKSEADKVIAELEKEIDKLQDKVTDLLLRDRNMALNFNNVFNALTRYKYKHCLDMADKCVKLCNKAKELYRWTEDEILERYYNRKIEFFARWHKRWLALAEKFKHNSTAQQGKG